MSPVTRVETLIIGASAAGLAVARCLQEAGHAATLVERRGHVAGMWRHAYDRLHLHTPRDRSGLPFQPMPASYPRYVSREQVVEYLDSYAAALTQPILAGHKAVSVVREGNDWITTTTDARFVSANVVVATGNTRVPLTPHFPEQDRYTGTILHSSAYKTGAAYRGQNVLVVGFGNSAAEIAMDLHEQGAHAVLSVRGPVNVIPREVLGIPVVSLGLLQKLLPSPVADAINAPMVQMTIGDITRYGLRKLPYGPLAEIREHHRVPVIDIGAMALIRSGAIVVRPGIERLTSSGVVFADGVEQDFAAIVLGTGYKADLHTLVPGTDAVLDADGTPLASGGATAAPGLYFCGFNVVPGGMLREIGREARALAALIAA